MAKLQPGHEERRRKADEAREKALSAALTEGNMAAAVEVERVAGQDGFRLKILDLDHTLTPDRTIPCWDGSYDARGGEWILSGRFRVDDRGVTLATYELQVAPPGHVESAHPVHGGWSEPASSALPRSLAPGISTAALRRFPPARVRRAILRELEAGDKLGTRSLPPDVEAYVATAVVHRGRPRQWLEADQIRFARRAIEMGVDGLGPVRKRLAHAFGIEERTATSRLHTARRRGYLAPVRPGHTEFLPGWRLLQGTEQEEET